jgi:hypothetical protein
MAAVDWEVKSSSLVVRPKLERYSNYGNISYIYIYLVYLASKPTNYKLTSPQTNIDPYLEGVINVVLFPK